MDTNATLVFTRGNEVTVQWLHHAVNLAAVERFAQRIEGLTNAGITKISFTESDYRTGSEGTNDLQSLRVYAHIFLRCEADNTVYALKIPAPISALLLDAYQEVPETIGNQIAQWYSDLAGELFTFEHGALAGSTA